MALVLFLFALWFIAGLHCGLAIAMRRDRKELEALEARVDDVEFDLGK